MLTPAQEQSLTSAGDCFEHYHSSDRLPQYSDVADYQSLGVVRSITGDYAITGAADFVLADTTLTSITITLPLAKAGREIEITKNAAPNALVIKTQLADKVLYKTEVRVYNYGTSLRFKAIPGGWIII